MAHWVHSIRTKFLVLFFVTIALFAVAALYLLSTLSSTVDRLSERLYEEGSGITQLVLNADRDLYQAMTGLLNVTLRQLDADTREAYAASYEENLQQTKERIYETKALIEKSGLNGLVHEASGLTLQDLLLQYENDLSSWESLTAPFVRNESMWMTLSQQKEADVLFENTRRSLDLIQDVMEHYSQQAIQEERD